ncbi:MAG: hypothetical protein KF850_23560 [Labilithrix sp.]|nr:hypothetical protein [Labilithrix sp.]MBX3215032.1 hypothetical protein [Labilithrix sp.]
MKSTQLFRAVVAAASLSLLVGLVACTSATDEDDDASEEVAAEAQAVATSPCTPRPLATETCHVWRRSERDSLGCGRGLGRGWTSWAQSACVRVPGSVCDRGVARRPTREEHETWPTCSP